MRYLVLTALFLTLPATAAEVIRVGKDGASLAIGHDGMRTWVEGDRVCVLQRAREAACGTVTKSSAKGAIVRLDNPNYDILAGDKVISKLRPSGAPPDPKPSNNAPLLNSVSDDNAGSDAHVFNITAGANIGTSFFYPVVQFQWALAPTVALGLGGLFLTASSTPANLTAFGGFASLNFYSREYFQGLWIQAAGGFVSMSVTGGAQAENGRSFLGFATVGWRGFWDLGLNIGIGAGAQYITDPGFVTITTTSSGLKPMVLVDIGFNF